MKSQSNESKDSNKSEGSAILKITIAQTKI